MTSPHTDRPTSTPKYVPPHRRHDATPSSQQYLNYEDLHTRYSPPNSPFRMPRVQRSLSIEDLRQRFKREQDGSQGQDSPRPPPPSPGQDSPVLLPKPESPPPPQAGLPPPPPSPPPPLPRDFEALRGHSHRPFGYSQSPPPLQRPFLSPRLPDPPVFTGVDPSRFEDWKLRIRNKLVLNGDHCPTEAFKIEYTISRLGGKAIEHTLPKRRTNSYHSVDQLLDHLSDIYDVPLEVVEQVDREAFQALEQGDRPFSEFYSDFMKYAPEHYFENEKRAVFELRCKLNYRLQKKMIMIYQEKPSLPELRDKLMLIDHLSRTTAARKAKKKAERFTKQLALASMEAKSKKPGKYAIMPPCDPEEFRR